MKATSNILLLFFHSLTDAAIGISRESMHQRRATGGKKKAWRKKRKNLVSGVITSCGVDRVVRIWMHSIITKTFFCMGVLRKIHTDAIKWCVWSPSGNLLATSCFDGIIVIWENQGICFSCVHVIEGDDKFVASISWNASGALLATCLPYRRIKIWKVSSETIEDMSGHVLAFQC